MILSKYKYWMFYNCSIAKKNFTPFFKTFVESAMYIQHAHAYILLENTNS